MKKLSSLLMLVALSLSMFSGAAFAVAGKFQFVNGEAQITDSKGQQRAVTKGGEVNEGDTVATSATGFAQIKMEDGGFFAVRPNTTFKIDTFDFNGKEDGSEKGVFSLIKGSLRSVTGLIGKTHRDNYKVQTATSTIGIRGSGADMGEDPIIGTAVRTLFGGHTLTKRLNGKDFILESGPGQIMLAKPDGVPEFVASFPFDTSNGGSLEKKKKDDYKKEDKNKQQLKEAEKDKVEIPIKSTSDFDFTNLTEDTGVAAAVGSGGGAVGLFNGGAGSFIDFNVVDVAGLFSATVNADDAVIGWRDDNGGSGIDTFALGSGTVTIDGTDSTLGVVWGRWSTFTASNSLTGAITPYGGLSFITAEHVTTTPELAGLTGLGTTVSYSYLNPGSGAAAIFNGGVTGVPVITGGNVQVTASVNFVAQTLSYNLDVLGPGAVGIWSAAGGGTFANFMSSTGIALGGMCSGAASGSCSGGGMAIAGKAVGGFVNTDAAGMISTFGLGNAAGDKLGGSVYLKR